jgi:hypothetical protein
MSDEQRTVQMHLMNPGSTAPDGDFTFELQPRFNAGRIVKFALLPRDADMLHKALGAYIKEHTKKA